MRQSANEAALFQRRDQPMYAGFRGKVERLLHLVERGRNAGLLQPLMDVQQEFVLLVRQHFALPHETCPDQPGTKPERPYMFCLRSARGMRHRMERFIPER